MHYKAPILEKRERDSELDTLCAKLGITCESKLMRTPINASLSWRTGKPVLVCPSKDEWDDTAFHYYVTLKFKDRTMETPFKCGYGHTKIKHLPSADMVFIIPLAPSAADVIYSLVMDSDACEQSFAEWCGNYGYDTDSRKALDLYEQCQISGDKVRKFLGADFSKFQGVEH